MKHIIRLFILIAALVLGTDHALADVPSNPRVKFVYVDENGSALSNAPGSAFAGDADDDRKVTIAVIINEGQDYRCIEGDLTAEQSINSNKAEAPRRALGKGVPVPVTCTKTNEFTLTLPEDESTNVTVYVKFSEKDSFTPEVSIEGWTYGDEAKTPTITGNTSGGAVTYTYADAVDGTYTETVPTLAGPHYVKATVVASADYKECESAPVEFTISKALLTVTANDHRILYGNAAANNGVTYDGFVNNEDESVLEGTLTYTYSNGNGNYGEGNDAPGSYQITPGGLTSNNYDITFVPGVLEVCKVYVPVSVVDIADGEEIAGAQVQVIGQTEVVEEWTSTTENYIIEGLKTGIEYTLHETVAPDGYTIPADYKFTIAPNGSITFTGNKTNEGVLLVENAPQVTVTITGKTETPDYNGTEQSVSGYDVVISNTLYTEENFTFSGTAEAKGTNAGTYYMELKAENFVNINPNFDVTFDVTDGYLTINPKAVTVKADDKSKASGTDDPELTATVEGLIGEDVIIYTISREEGDVAGDYVITPTGEATQGNYTVTYETGTFTIFEIKDIATFPEADIIVPDQTLEGPDNPFDNIYHKFDYANNNYSQDYAQAFIAGMGVVVKDGNKTLTLGTDYTFGSVTMANGNPIPDKSEIDDVCKVEIVGIGYYTGTVTREFNIVAPDANGSWGDNMNWAFHEGTLTITGTGAMNATTQGSYPWFSSANYIKTITIGEGVSTVAAEAFSGTSNVHSYGNLASINLPSTLTTIGNNAFAFCTGATITIPTSVTTLGNNPFNQVGCVVVSKPLEDGNDNSDIISKMSYAQNATFTYKRSFTDNVASTVCLPFDYTPQGEGKYYTFTTIDKTTSPWTVTMTTYVDALTANTPYMFLPVGINGEVTFTGTASSFIPSNVQVDDPVVTGGVWNFIGTYESRLWNDTHNTEEIGSVYGFAAQSYDGGSYTVSPGDFVKAMAGASIAPFRAYLKYTAPVSNAPRRGTAEETLPSRMTVRLVNADGDVTAIGTIDTKTGEIRFDSEAWYTLDGRRLDSKPAQKGVYINNGKKIVIK